MPLSTRTPVAVIVAILIAAPNTGCGGLPVTRVTVQSFEARSVRTDPGAAFNVVSAALVERGFDIKTANRDAGLLTTEYQKFASEGSNPPFDYLLQIRTTVNRGADGRVAVKMTPVVREQNRLNAAAFTEHELSYYTGEPQRIRMIKSMRADGWRSRGQTLFVNVASDVAAKLGTTLEDLQKNLTETSASALTAKE
ncbi:MAG: hypothetical protein AVDCRST_MAG68-4406 [uncultured Gemmatimonadetes bacterium]|uniref:Uncharacterized protein n=1 Tax=uncultured Gemmatimonadota bacterium TaxID=203437 RepID=A0A6J4MDG0_9BACT|nr:MAG: hypothetical protein AVDCRST_MAG68-4406 [uncultured Gemmatimonadota bacterium]